MSPEVTSRKLSLLIENIDLLKKYKNAGIPKLNKNHLEVERLLHLIVEIACDINYHLIVQQKGHPPKSLFDSFLEMADLKIIPKKLALDLAPSAGLRNALVHMYDRVETLFIQKSIHSIFTFFPEYIKCIQKSIQDFLRL